MPDHPPPAPDWVLGDDGHWKPPGFSASGPGAAPPTAWPAPVPATSPEPPTPPRAPIGLVIAVAVLVVAVAAAGIFVVTRGDTDEPAVAGPIADDEPALTTEPTTTTAPSMTTSTSTTTAPVTTVAPHGAAHHDAGRDHRTGRGDAGLVPAGRRARWARARRPRPDAHRARG
ncbi:MAG TPA: hypothetical protein VF228_15780 [Iamia sp.]